MNDAAVQQHHPHPDAVSQPTLDVDAIRGRLKDDLYGIDVWKVDSRKIIDAMRTDIGELLEEVDRLRGSRDPSVECPK